MIPSEAVKLHLSAGDSLREVVEEIANSILIMASSPLGIGAPDVAESRSGVVTGSRKRNTVSPRGSSEGGKGSIRSELLAIGLQALVELDTGVVDLLKGVKSVSNDRSGLSEALHSRRSR